MMNFLLLQILMMRNILIPEKFSETAQIRRLLMDLKKSFTGDILIVIVVK